MKEFYKWIIFIVIAIAQTSYAIIIDVPDQDEHELKNQLFNDYDASIRPVLHKEDPVVVTFGLSLHQIIDVVEKEEKIICVLWLRQKWTNPLLAWNESDFGGIKEINVDPANVWKPDIILYTNIDDGADGAMDKFDTKVTVTSDGRNKWLAPVIVKSSCKIDVTNFPFDEQHCVFKFGSWTFDGFRVDMQLEGPEGVFDKFITNGEWDLVGIPAKRNVQYYVCCPEPYPDLTYTVIIRRRTMYFWFNLIIPCLLITALTGLSFLLPSDCGERIGLVITNLLALSMFMLLVADFLPTTSEVVPLISMYFGGTFVIVSMCLVSTVMSLRFHFGAPMASDVPVWMRIVVFDFLAKVVHYPKDLLPQKPDPTDDAASTTKSQTAVLEDVFEDGLGMRYRKTPSQDGRGYVVAKPFGQRPFMGYGTVSDNPYTKHNEPRPCCPCKFHGDLPETRKQSYPGFRNIPLPPSVSENSLQSTPSSQSQVDGDHSPCVQALRKQLQAISETQDKLVQYSETIANKTEDDEESDAREDEWRTVGAVFDRFFLIVFIFVLFIATVAIFLQAPAYPAIEKSE